MTTAAHVPSDVESYLARVRTALADVPDEERNDLLAEVEASLYESASETGGAIAARLGPPEAFAAELRTAAGLHPATTETAGLRISLERLAADPRLRDAARLLRELAPVWWVVRGYVAVAAFALLIDADWSVSHHTVPRLGSAEAGVAFIAFAILASIALGLWSRRRGASGRYVLAAANVALLAAAVPVVQHVAEGAPTTVATQTFVQTEIVPGLAYNGTPLRNVYPFSRDGRPLRDVFLYTDYGAPIDVLTGFDPNRRVVRTTTGRSVFNVFPIRYYEPGTKTVRRPGAGPAVKVPVLATPPLQPRKRR